MDKIKAGERDFSIIESKKFETCGVMIDVSRNAVLKVKTVKDILRKIALMGMNMLMLYTEDTYKIDDYPYFGYMRGTYSKEEIKEMDAYAKLLGIEMIPCIQTLAHLKTTLRWQYASEMKDTDDILLVDEPKTYAFIEKMLQTVSECFSSKKVHIGMDEAHMVGLGTYLQKHGYVNRFDILIRHLNKVNEILQKYNLEPMMWSDMFFRLASKKGEYRDIETVIPPDISDKIPDNISMVYWDYSTEDLNTYDIMLKKHNQLGREVIFAGGIWRWEGMGVNYQKTFSATIPALKACRNNGIKHVFATTWGDDGALVSVYSVLLGLQLFAEYNYYDNVDMDFLKERFKVCTGYDMDAFLLLQVDDFNRDKCHDPVVNVSKQILFQDILQGLFDKNLEYFDVAAFYQEKSDKLSKIDKQGDLENLFQYQRQLVKVIMMKSDLGIKITKAYQLYNKEELEQYIEVLNDLKNEVYKLKELAMELWYNDNKPFGFDSFDLRIGGLISRIETASKRLSMFIEGKIDKIEELEEERLFYKGDNIDPQRPLVREKHYVDISKASI